VLAVGRDDAHLVGADLLVDANSVGFGDGARSGCAGKSWCGHRKARAAAGSGFVEGWFRGGRRRRRGADRPGGVAGAKGASASPARPEERRRKATHLFEGDLQL
jgi:hypothetical protein